MTQTDPIAEARRLRLPKAGDRMSIEMEVYEVTDRGAFLRPIDAAGKILGPNIHFAFSELAHFTLASNPESKPAAGVTEAQMEAVLDYAAKWSGKDREWLRKWLPGAIRSVLASAAPAAPETIPAGWQPIETAPKDGSTVLVAEYVPHDRNEWCVLAAHYIAKRRRWYEVGDFGDDDFSQPWKPTHWMPFPLPPAASAVSQPPASDSTRETGNG